MTQATSAQHPKAKNLFADGARFGGQRGGDMRPPRPAAVNHLFHTISIAQAAKNGKFVKKFFANIRALRWTKGRVVVL